LFLSLVSTISATAYYVSLALTLVILRIIAWRIKQRERILVLHSNKNDSQYQSKVEKHHSNQMIKSRNSRMTSLAVELIFFFR